MIARLQPGITYAQAQAAMQVFFPQPPQLPRNMRPEVEVQPAGRGLSQLRAEYRRPLLALVVLVTLVLLTTCTNVGNLLMLRHTARRRELTVRVALGARRSRLILQYFVESLILAVMGGILALAIARWGVSIILSMLPLPSFPESLKFQADARTLGFAAGLSVLSAMLFGLAPAWRAAHVDLAGALRSSQAGTPTRDTRRFGRILVACQVGLSVILLVGAGLFVQTLRNLTLYDVGFNPDRLLQVLIDTRFAGYREGQVGAVYRLLLERVSAIPGVQSVTGIRNPMMRHSGSRSAMILPGLEPGPDESWESADVGPHFFETLGIPVLRGRTFTVDDFERGGPLFVVNEAFVKRYFPDGDPVARQIGIIGVVGDVKLAGVRTPGGPMMYQLSRREPDRLNALEVRAAGDPEAIVPAIREELRRVNPRLLAGIRTMRQEIDQDIARERLVAAISGFFSVLGLLLASIGIFGVASYSVAQRTPELGIRMALGAGRWALVRESMGDTVRVFAIGLVAGIVAAIAAVRLASSYMSDLLFGLTATDSANLAAAVAVMVVVALAACALPARRATRVDPLTAIRCE
jgi:predicted permease